METIAGGPAARPLRRDAERNRRRILEAAGALFAERGLGVSLDDIADRAEVGIGTVYRRFPDRDALIDALFDEQLEAVASIAEAALAIEDPWGGLEHFLRTAMELQARNRGLKEILLGTRMIEEVGCAAGSRARIEPLVTRLVERARAAGGLRDDVATTDMPLIQLMVGSVVDYTRDVDPEVWHRLLTLVLDGLRAAPEARTPMPSAPLSGDDVARVMSNWCPRRA